jgi:DNA-binding NarL/FixJ family response regulator
MTILCSILDDPRAEGDRTFGVQESPLVPESSILRPRILLADDHPEVLEALRFSLDELGEVVGMVGDGQALVEAARLLEPDLIFSDISMPRMNGLDATRALLAFLPQCKVIILTVHREAVYLSLAFNAGARGYVLKRSAVAELPHAVLHVLAGDRYIGQGVGGSEEWTSAKGDEATTWRSTL